MRKRATCCSSSTIWCAVASGSSARYRKYEELARTDGSRFHPTTESVSEACIKFDDPAHVAADALGRVAGFAENGWPTNGAPLIKYLDQK